MHETPSLLPESLPRSFFRDAANIWPSTQRGSGAEGHAYRVFPCVKGDNTWRGAAEVVRTHNLIRRKPGNADETCCVHSGSSRPDVFCAPRQCTKQPTTPRKRRRSVQTVTPKCLLQKLRWPKTLTTRATATKGMIILWPNTRLLSEEYSVLQVRRMRTTSAWPNVGSR